MISPAHPGPTAFPWWANLGSESPQHARTSPFSSLYLGHQEVLSSKKSSLARAGRVAFVARPSRRPPGSAPKHLHQLLLSELTEFATSWYRACPSSAASSSCSQLKIAIGRSCQLPVDPFWLFRKRSTSSSGSLGPLASSKDSWWCSLSGSSHLEIAATPRRPTGIMASPVPMLVGPLALELQSPLCVGSQLAVEAPCFW